MPVIVSATNVTVWTSISASASTILNKKLIEVVEQRIPIMTNNYFVSDDIQVTTTATFNATANTIIIDQNSWEEFGFLAGDPIFIYSSYRNDGYVTISGITDNVATISSAYSMVNEYFSSTTGKSITFFLVRFPIDVQMIAAEMVYFDNDVRSKKAANIRSRSLGPLSESFTSDSESNFGYPNELVDKLSKYNIARLM